LLPRVEALQRVGIPSNVTDPFLPIARNAFRAPRVAFYDVSLIKQFPLTEKTLTF